jgi:hypothetical protein
MEEAESSLLEAQTMHREQGSARGVADAFVALGILRALQGRPADGLTCLREALAIHVEEGDVIRQEKVLGFGGLVGHDAREVARGLPRDVLARAPKSSIDVLPAHVAELVHGEREAGERWQHAIELYRDGVAADDRGDPGAAIGLFDRAIHALERAGVRRGVSVVHAHTAAALAVTGDRAEAAARLERARRALGPHDDGGGFAVSVFAAAVDVIGGGDTAAPRELLARATRVEISTAEIAVAARVLARSLAAPTKALRAAFVVGRESRWIHPPGAERFDLVRYGPIRRLLERLIAARLEEPGVALSADALIDTGWPGERMRHTAGLLRVYSAIRRLRRLGLGPILITRDDGYLIDPHAEVDRSDG